MVFVEVFDGVLCHLVQAFDLRLEKLIADAMPVFLCNSSERLFSGYDVDDVLGKWYLTIWSYSGLRDDF